MLENIKQTKDKEQQDDESINEVRSLLKLMKMYIQKDLETVLRIDGVRY